MAGAARVVNKTVWSPQVAPHETLQAEAVLGLVGDPHPLAACVLPEPGDAGCAGRCHGVGCRVGGEFRLGERSDDEDLVAVRIHGWGAAEPVGGEAAGEPALELIG